MYPLSMYFINMYRRGLKYGYGTGHYTNNKEQKIVERLWPLNFSKFFTFTSHLANFWLGRSLQSFNSEQQKYSTPL